MVGIYNGVLNNFYPQNQMMFGRAVSGSKVGQTQDKECQTCKNRKYQDGSNDQGVSFKTPTKLDRNKAPAAIRAHESEHVGRERAKAKAEGREVVSQNVTYKTAICPECGRVYVSGGTTVTMTRASGKNTSGIDGGGARLGQYLDVWA